MKLYITPGSPYARMARITVLEKRLEGRVEVLLAQTRTAHSPYYAINPSGRVPYLVRDDALSVWRSRPSFARGSIISQASRCSICRRVKRYGRCCVSKPWPEACWMDFRFGYARSCAPKANVHHPSSVTKSERASRMADLWETEIAHPWMRGALNLAQITLGCALGLEARNPDLHWRPGHAKLSDWFGRIAARPSFVATAPQAVR